MDSLTLGSFLIFESDIYGDSLYCGGVVTGLTNEQGLYEVQLYQGNDTCMSWMPAWRKEGSKDRNCKNRPVGYKPWVILIKVSAGEMVGIIRDTYIMTEDTLAHLRSKGFMDEDRLSSQY